MGATRVRFGRKVDDNGFLQGSTPFEGVASNGSERGRNLFPRTNPGAAKSITDWSRQLKSRRTSGRFRPWLHFIEIPTIIQPNKMDSDLTLTGQSVERQNRDWSEAELQAAVDAYQEMLDLQQAGRPFSKSKFNEELRAGPLAKRSKAAVEYWMQNISAVFQERQQPWVQGYPPAANLGTKVRRKIVDYLDAGSPGRSSRRRKEHLLDAITKEHIEQGIRLFEGGYEHEFKDSTKFDLVHSGKHYPPKAIIGLAAVPLYGAPFQPDDFTGGAGSKCFRVLTSNGFKIVPKEDGFRPTSDPRELEAKAREALTAPFLPEPVGQAVPEQISRQSLAFKRDPLVVAFSLKRAEGVCECCKKPAPFRDKNGSPFLEVHHIVPLAEGGEDKPCNTVAICPNCHRECHHGENADGLKSELQKRMSEAN